MIQDRKITAYSKTHAMLATEPNDTLSADQLKAWWDTAPEEARAAINGIVDDIIADYATKAELSGVQLGQISPGTITPTQLSFDPATQAELNAHTGATTGIHGATSAATANTLAFRDTSGRLQVAAPSATADAVTKGYADGTYSRIPQTGTYTGDGAVSRDIALPFTPSAVYLNPKVYGTNGGSSSAGLALNGSPLTISSNANYLLIGTNKFTVYGSPLTSNTSGDIYYYIAFP